MTYQRQILRVDLGTGQICREPVSEDLRRKYLGGDGINSRLLWEHFLKVKPAIDPLGPDNVLIAGIGPLGATGFGAGSKTQFTYKSPAYGIFGGTSSGGGFGSQLRWAGYDHVVVTGKAEQPVYIWINDDEVEIRDAREFWGKTAEETDEAIKQVLGDGEAEVACIGPAGENQVRFASIVASRHRAAGRGGGGCVMGSKNLKAIVARGTRGIKVHDPGGLLRAIDEYLARTANLPRREQHMRYGTLVFTRMFHQMGFLTYRNGQGYGMPDEKADRLDHSWYAHNAGARVTACSPGCLFACCHWHRIGGDETPGAREHAGEWGTRPEYGCASPFGSSCDVPDLLEVSHLIKMCNEYGMDVMEMGMGVSLLMELWERGVIGQDDTLSWTGQPLSLEWGNYRAVEELIKATALRQNKLGEVLQGGVYQAAREISDMKDTNVLKYASYGKAGATHGGAVRSWPALSFACAVEPIGAHHTKGFALGPATSVKYFGRPDAGDMLSTALTGPGHAIGENLLAVTNSMGVCFFIHSRYGEVPLELTARAMGAVTGIELTEEELMAAGERIANIQKAFNSRLGLRREHDTLCERWLNEPQPEGASKGLKGSDYLERAKDEYYRLRGWDVQTSLQTRKKLEELDMLDVTQVLAQEGTLA